jgi:transposase
LALDCLEVDSHLLQREAGPDGFDLLRLLRGAGVACDVIAPSLVPVRAGVRVKTDRRDAKKLVRLFRAGELTFVAAPTPQTEGLRDLLRCRDDLRGATALLSSCCATVGSFVTARRAGRACIARGLPDSVWTTRSRSLITNREPPRAAQALEEPPDRLLRRLNPMQLHHAASRRQRRGDDRQLVHIQRDPQTHINGRDRANVRHGWSSSIVCGSGQSGPQHPQVSTREGATARASRPHPC